MRDALRLLVLAALVMAVVSACERERRVPYIPPKLERWERPYRGEPGLELHVFRTGALRRVGGPGLLPVPRSKTTRLPVLAYVLAHPREGLIVIDTGLNHELAERPESYLDRLTGASVEADLEAGEELPAQMLAAGLDPSRVRRVVVSNLQFHHAGELEAFENATVVVSKSEHRRGLERPPGYVVSEFDDVQSWEFVDVRRNGLPLGTMPASLDLLGDGSLVLIDAPGPTEGNLAILLRLMGRAVVLAGDLAPLPETIRYAARPASLSDADAWWDNIWRLKRFGDLEAALLVVPGQATAPLEEAALRQVHLHEYEAPSGTPTR